MINEITCNSNNTIELSRGQLLQWLNHTLKINYSKIQQMGSGAAYCQLLDLIYPGKVPMSKVNWKAKHEYQYVQNFKVLQQSFVKLNIMRHVDVERLVKCKYQDNLEMLQWFKKIFDTTSSNKEYDPIGRRGEKTQRNQKQNKTPLADSNFQAQKIIDTFKEKQKNNLLSQNLENQKIKTQDLTPVKKSQLERQSPRKVKFMGQIETNTEHRLVDLLKENQSQQKLFYLKKISQIQHLMEQWNIEKSSADLITQIRKIILVAPQTSWSIENGEFIESLQNIDFQEDNI